MKHGFSSSHSIRNDFPCFYSNVTAILLMAAKSQCADLLTCPLLVANREGFQPGATITDILTGKTSVLIESSLSI